MSNRVLAAECKRKLAALWFGGSGLIFLVLLLQTIFGHYGENVRDVWGWFLTSTMPTLSIIVGVLVTDALGKGRQVSQVDIFIYRLSFWLSVIYILLISLVISIQPFVIVSPINLMRESHVWLGPFQGLVTASLGAFFISK